MERQEDGYTGVVQASLKLKPKLERRTQRWVMGAVLTCVLLPLGALSSSVLWLPDHIEYIFDGSTLTIETGRPWWHDRERIDLGEVADVFVARLEDRIVIDGVELPGYVVGRFAYRGLGEVWQATSGSHEVIVLDIVTRPLPVIVSPEEHATFLWAMRAGRSLTLRPPRVDHRFGWWILRGVSVLPLLLTLVVPAIFFVAPARMRYRLEQDGCIVITTLFMGRPRFDLSGATVQRRTPRLRPRGLAISIPGYHVGRFSDAGEPTSVFATAASEGVLLQSPDRSLRLYISPEEPQLLLDHLAGDLAGDTTGKHAEHR